MARSKSLARPAPPVTSPSASVSKIWIILALLSIAANVGLTLRVANARKVDAAPPAPPPASTLTGAQTLSSQLTPYAALGTFLAENNHIASLKWTEEQFAAFQQGVRASYLGHGYPLDEPALKLRDEVSAKVQAMLGQTPQDNADPVEDYFRSLREKENVTRAESGLHYRITQPGFGKTPGPDSTIVVSYGARLPDGKALPELSRQRARVAVASLLPGMAEGVQLLKTGGKALIYLPAALSFADGQWPQGVGRGAPLIFFIELHEVVQ